MSHRPRPDRPPAPCPPVLRITGLEKFSGGGVIVMFGMMIAAGVSLLSDVHRSRLNTVIFAISLTLGLGLQLEPGALSTDRKPHACFCPFLPATWPGTPKARYPLKAGHKKEPSLVLSAPIVQLAQGSEPMARTFLSVPRPNLSLNR